MKRRVLLLVLTAMLLAVPFGTANAGEPKDIVDTAVEAGNFTTLAAALKKADLVDTLKGEGPFTVFAPTDDAFAALLKELNITAEQLLARKDLKDILLYHVAPGRVTSADLKDGQKIKTVEGSKVKVSLDPVRVNNAKVVQPDIMASNGVIHVIDKVLLPPGK